MKKYIIALLVVVILCGIRYTNPWFLDVMRLKALDSHQRLQQTETIDNIVTIESAEEIINAAKESLEVPADAKKGDKKKANESVE